MKKAVALMVACIMMVTITGCSPEWQKKFVRKKKDVKKAPRIYQLKKYEKKPSLELYRKHYVYWETWQSELIEVLGYNHKKDVRCVTEALSNLQDMRNVLVPEKGDKLTKHINSMAQVKDMVMRNDESQPARRDYIRQRLERIDRVIKAEFSPKMAKNYIKKSFDEEQAGSAEESDELKPGLMTKAGPADAVIAKEEAREQNEEELRAQAKEEVKTSGESQ
jgi:hypothetical protein